jgi:hypothetical protein
VFKHDGPVFDLGKDGPQGTEKYPADHQDHGQIAQLGEIILYGSDCIFERRTQNFAKSSTDYVGARKDRESGSEVEQKQDNHQGVTEQSVDQPKYSAGMKPRIGFAGLTAFPESGLPCLDPFVYERVRRTNPQDGQQEGNGENQHVVKTWKNGD